MSAEEDPPVAPTPEAPGEGAPQTVAGRLSGYLRGGGIITPFLTALLAFVVGGLVVALEREHGPVRDAFITGPAEDLELLGGGPGIGLATRTAAGGDVGPRVVGLRGL